MDFLYYIRDHLVGTHYFIYSFILNIFMFSMIGYLFKQKYGKLDVILNTSQKTGDQLISNKSKKNKEKKKNEPKVVQSTTTTPHTALNDKNVGIAASSSKDLTTTVQTVPNKQASSQQSDQTNLSKSGSVPEIK